MMNAKMLYIYDSCVIYMIMSCHMWISHDSVLASLACIYMIMCHTHKSCAAYEWAMLYVYKSCPRWISHDPWRCLPVYTSQYVVMHVDEWMRHVLPMNGSYIAHERVMPHMNWSWQRPDTACLCAMAHTNESHHMSLGHITYEWVMSYINESYQIWMSHVTDESVMKSLGVARLCRYLGCATIQEPRVLDCRASASI